MRTWTGWAILAYDLDTPRHPGPLKHSAPARQPGKPMNEPDSAAPNRTRPFQPSIYPGEVVRLSSYPSSPRARSSSSLRCACVTG